MLDTKCFEIGDNKLDCTSFSTAEFLKGWSLLQKCLKAT